MISDEEVAARLETLDGMAAEIDAMLSSTFGQGVAMFGVAAAMSIALVPTAGAVATTGTALAAMGSVMGIAVGTAKISLGIAGAMGASQSLVDESNAALVIMSSPMSTAGALMGALLTGSQSGTTQGAQIGAALNVGASAVNASEYGYASAFDAVFGLYSSSPPR